MSSATIDPDRFRKVWTMAQQGATQGERDAAMGRAEVMLAGAGLTLDDVPAVLAEDPAPQEEVAGFTFYDMNNPAHVAAWSAGRRSGGRRWRDATRPFARR
ncbi:hypothetical protein GXW78_20195 [Roseomonas terrae]|uniref:Uncharacterized protein n=1 Tax=Neoroseomonas terrae TaxID=424799 RepID=A0ABS5ELW2_9PROT|nr:hypothetical protein [Neoroseomonas terrae]MBR0651997.1 hypothetical protein [Neoroseomonas terrae]